MKTRSVQELWRAGKPSAKPLRQTNEIRQPFGSGRLNAWETYVLAIVVTVATVGVRLALASQLGERPTLVVFTMPIMLSAYFGGLRAGLLATLLSYFGASYYLLPPFRSFRVASVVDRWDIFFVVLAGVIISGLNEAMHRARHRADLATREQQARAAVAKAEVLQSAIFNSDNFSCIATDEKGVIQLFNVGAERMFGYTAAEVTNKITPADLHDPEGVIAHAAALSLEFGTPIGPHFEALSFKASRGIEDIFEITKIRKNGSRFPATVSVTALRGAEGGIIGYLLIGTDNTARKRAEDDRNRFFALSRDALCILGFDSHFKDLNPAWEKTLGYTRAELLATPFIDLIHPDDREATLAEAANVTGGKSLTAFENRYRCKDGSYRCFQWSVTPVVADQVMYGVARDVTERKVAAEKIRQLNVDLEQRVIERTAQLVAANKELEAFSYSISHDLRAPLRAINGFAGIVLEDFSPQLPAEGKRHLERIRNGGQRMGLLIDDLLAFSQLSRQPVNRQNVNTTHLVQNVLDELKQQHEGRLIEIPLGILPECHGDPALLKQVWVNLLSNAFKYTLGREPAIVEIGSVTENNEDVYFVRDNGAGFDMRYAGKLFGVFQRLHRADEFEGTGVGLAIVQRIVNRHGGRVWAEAKVGQGATFHFTLEGKNKT